MSLQSSDLMMVALGIVGDEPPNKMQPPLADGIHLRWACSREIGFPWWGFHLFRRDHRPAKPMCISYFSRELKPGIYHETSIKHKRFHISSDVRLKLTDLFPPRGALEYCLSDREYLKIELPADDPAYSARITLAFTDPAKVSVKALHEGQVIEHLVVEGKDKEPVTVDFTHDAITAIWISSGPAVMVDACFYYVSDQSTERWESVPRFSYPYSLPVRHSEYPAWQGSVDEAVCENKALSRIRYGNPHNWQSQFSELHEQLLLLVQGGPTSQPMAERAVTTQPPPDQSQAEQPSMMQYPLDLVHIACLDPAIAQMIGLYWVDQSARMGRKYDYLIIADTDGRCSRDPNVTLRNIQNGFTNVTAHISFGVEMKKLSPLAAPDNARVYSLPGGTIPRLDGKITDAQTLAGIRWNVSDAADGIVMYHVWRCDLGKRVDNLPDKDQYKPITSREPVLVAEGEDNLKQRKNPPLWPPGSLFLLDAGLKDGWYSYLVSSIDIFGRHSLPGEAARWYEYDEGSDQEKLQHEFAVQLLDKMPPPVPTALQAYVLDPDDPTLIRDQVYRDWYQSLSQQQRKVAGLRVMWKWTDDHDRQAPDVREFRIYFHPGSAVPDDEDDPRSWNRRLWVVPYDQCRQSVIDGRRVRLYDVLLSADDIGSLLEPALASPVAYGNVGVTAVDDKDHTLDHLRTGAWANRRGNEGAVSAPVRIYQVLRTAPEPAPPPPDGECVYASAPDYHNKSYYTYRWRAVDHLKVHVYRALDDAVFNTDWKQRATRFVISSDDDCFPDEPRWDEAKRVQVALELNALNDFPRDDEGRTDAFDYYRSLSNDALRVLASTDGAASAFSQITTKPVSPDDESTHDRPGPDNRLNHPVSSELRVFIDELPAGSNSYFYRSAYVDGAHNQSKLGLASPPVKVKDIVSPRSPVITKVAGGCCQVEICWAANRERDLASYRVYRTDTKANARDMRLMELVATVDKACKSWIDEDAPGMVTRWYRVSAIDDTGNESKPSPAVPGRAYDDSLPVPPVPDVSYQTIDGDDCVVISWSADTDAMLQRQSLAGGMWFDLTGYLPAGDHEIIDRDGIDAGGRYRLVARKRTGAVGKGDSVDYQPVEGS